MLIYLPILSLNIQTVLRGLIRKRFMMIKTDISPYIRVGEVRISIGSVSGEYENRELL